MQIESMDGAIVGTAEVNLHLSTPEVTSFRIRLTNILGAWYHLRQSYPYPIVGDRCFPPLVDWDNITNIPEDSFPLTALIAPRQTLVFDDVRLRTGDRFALCHVGFLNEEAGVGADTTAVMAVTTIDMISVGFFGTPIAGAVVGWNPVTAPLAILSATLDAVGADTSATVISLTRLLADPGARRIDYIVAMTDLIASLRSVKAALVNALRSFGVAQSMRSADRILTVFGWLSSLLNIYDLIQYFADAAAAYDQVPFGATTFEVVEYVRWDDRAPDGYVLSPSSGDVVGNSALIEGTAFDDCSDIDFVNVTWSTDNWQTFDWARDSTPPYAVTLDFSSIPDGTEVLIGWDVYDSAGNHQDSPRGNIRVVKNAAALQPDGDDLLLVRHVTYPQGASAAPSQVLRKTWRVRNTGNARWGNNYQLVRSNDSTALGVAIQDLPNLAPGQEADVSIEIQIPNEPGLHTASWLPHDAAGRSFGDGLPFVVAVGDNCGLRVCGLDGFGSSCGRCADDELCTAEGRCIVDCVLACNGAICGPSNCPDRTCGNCAAGQICEGGRCINPGELVLTTSLNLPINAEVGEAIRGSFIIRNETPNVVHLDRLTIGGRGPAGDGDIRDFPHMQGLRIGAGENYRYEANYVPAGSGSHRFFVAYQYNGDWLEPSVQPGVVRERLVDVVRPEAAEWLVETFCVANAGGCDRQFERGDSVGGHIEITSLNNVQTTVEFVYVNADTNQIIRTHSMNMQPINDRVVFNEPRRSLPADGRYELGINVTNGEGRRPYGPVVSFTYGDAQYHEGMPYKGPERPNVCIFHGGRCYHIVSEALYRHLYPNDPGFDLLIDIPQVEYDRIEASAPCAFGEAYSGAVLGCILHDPLLLGDADHFVVVNGFARRMSEPSARNCFDPERIFTSRGVASALDGDDRRVFQFSDSSDEPYYCDPSVGSQTIACGACSRREERCDRNICQIVWSACESECRVDEICEAGRCEPAFQLIPGQITAPADDAFISNDGFDVHWSLGSANDGTRVRTGLLCRVNGGPWEVEHGYGDAVSSRLPDYNPGTRIECKVRTRVNADSEWVDSPVVQWIANSDAAQMHIVRIDFEEDPNRDGCDTLRFEALVRNEGNADGSWIAGIWLHRAGGSPEDPDAFEWDRTYRASADAGDETILNMFVVPPWPIQLDGETELTVRLADEDRGFGAPVEFTVPVPSRDNAVVTITRFIVYGLDNGSDAPVGLIAGHSFELSAAVHDDYQVANVVVDWRVAGGPWLPIDLDKDLRGCATSFSAQGAIDVPAGLANGTMAEVRLRATDLANNEIQQVINAQVSVPIEPVVRFATPTGGEQFIRYFAGKGDCVPTRFFVSSSIPIRSLSVGLGVDDGRGIRVSQQTINPIPEDGWVEHCVRASALGDRLRVIVRVYDDNRDEHFFASEPFGVEPHPPEAPWSELQVEETQLSLPWSDGGYRPEIAYKGLHVENGRIIVYREDIERLDAHDDNDRLSITKLEFSLDELQLMGSTPLLVDAPRVDVQGFSNRLDWNSIADEFDAVFLHYDDPDCRDDCDRTIRYRKLTGSQVGPISVVDRIRNAWSLTHAGFLADGTARLLAINSRVADESRGILYRLESGNWSRLRDYPFTFRSFHRWNDEIWTIRPDGDVDAGTLTINQRVLDPRTGEVVRTVPILELPFSATTALTTSEDIPNGVLRFHLRDWQTDLFWLGYHGENGWTVSEGQAPPDIWRGRSIQSWDRGSLMEGGPWLMYQVIPERMDREYVLVPFNDGEPVDFERAFHDLDDSRLRARPNRRLLLARWVEWNFEHRLSFEQTLQNEGCYDADPCTTDGWNPDLGQCVFEPLECEQDGNLCNGVEACNPTTGQCEAQAVECDDGDLCNGAEACDLNTGECVSGEPAEIDDRIACTTDACDSATGEVTHEVDDERCVASACNTAQCVPDDPNALTTGCIEVPRVIEDDGLACTVGVCDPETRRVHHEPVNACVIGGACIAVGAVNPNNPCEICDPSAPGRWSAASGETPCDDGRFCTVDDHCSNRTCNGAARGCDGVLQDPACQRVSCVEAADECQVDALVDGAPCGNGDLCDGRETCRGGRCVAGEAPPLESENPCIAFECDAILGVQAVEVDGACDADSDPCTVDDACVAGECIAGDPMDCSSLDGDCIRGRCDVEGDEPACVAEPIADDNACDDGEACSRDDRCLDGACHGDAFECTPAGVCEDARSAQCDGDGGCTYDALVDDTPCPGGACAAGRCAVDGDECQAALALNAGERLVLELTHATPSVAEAACFDDEPSPDIWLQFGISPGAAYTVHIRLIDSTGLAVGVTDACSADAPCLDNTRVGAGEAVSVGPFRVEADATRLVTLHALCCGASQAEVWLEVQSDEEPCPEGTEGCACRVGDACDFDLICQNARCSPPGCPEGAEGCACRLDGGCDDQLVCQDDVCGELICLLGTAGCVCRSDESCDDDLVCQEDRCVAAPNCDDGTIGCACYGNGTCDEGLLCKNALCVEPPPCFDGSQDCPCYGNGTCDNGLRCVADQCELCPVGEEGCGCYGNGTCNKRLDCVEQRCEPAIPPIDMGIPDAAMPDAALVDLAVARDAETPADWSTTGSGSGDDGCCMRPGGSWGNAWWALGTLGLLALRRRRREC